MTPPSDARWRWATRQVRRRVLALAAVGAALAGCGAPTPELTTIAVPTSPPSDHCLDALVGGRVVASERWGIALQDLDGRVSEVLWPNGFRGVQDGARVALVDGGGQIVAEVGDTIQSGGGFVGANGDPDNTMLVCGEIKVMNT